MPNTTNATNATVTHDAALMAARRFLDVLRRENECLAAGDVPDAMALFPEKHDTAAVLQSVLRGRALPRPVADAILAATAENVSRLQAAMAVQSRILEIVALAARPKPSGYNPNGKATPPRGPSAFTMKA